ncbi:ArnT family glycosyltransferase [Candidatus Riflebacteria bacterium]
MEEQAPVNNEEIQETAGIRWARIPCLILILLLSLFLNLWNNDFPLGHHVDEIKKTHFIVLGHQDFHHPILMLDSVRLVNLYFRYEQKDLQKVVELGRVIMGIFATLTVLLFFLIIRGLLPYPYDLFCTFAVACSPALVIHAHYLKEDTIFTFCCMLSILAFFSLCRQATPVKTLYLGIATGLAVSSHFKGLLLFPLFFVGPFLFRPESRFLLIRRIFHAIPIAIWVFITANYPILKDASTFRMGMAYDMNKIQTGYGAKIFPLPHFFSFHLLNSILPGMTLFLALFSLLAILYFFKNWLQLEFEDRFLLLFIVVFYFVVEISPMKTFPDYMRYVLPLIPVMLYFFCKAFYILEKSISGTWKKMAVRFIFFFAIIYSLQVTLRLDYHMNRDTRKKVLEMVKKMDGRAHVGYFVDPFHGTFFSQHKLEDLRRDRIKYLVLSSFEYDEFEYGAKLKDQIPRVYEWAKAFEEIFSFPYKEIKPVYMSFAFSNPTIRIVDISSIPIPKKREREQWRRRNQR